MEQPKIITSEKFSLNWRDTAKSLVMTVIAAVFASIYEAIQKDGDLSRLNWKTIGVTALITGLGYLFKNGVLESPKTIVITSSNEQTKQVSKDIKTQLK